MPAASESQSATRVPVAGLLAWLVPGLGHIYLGDLHRGLVLMVVIAVTFWGGVAIGGVADTVNRQERTAWFMAQVCAGSHGFVGHFWSQRIRDREGISRVPAPWLSVEVGVIYSGVAGLLNLLTILDALARADASARQPDQPISGRAPPRTA